MQRRRETWSLPCCCPFARAISCAPESWQSQLLQFAQVVVVAIFAALNIILYHTPNFFIDPNVAYIGCVFAMFGVFNIAFFPMLYRTGYKLALPLIIALVLTLLFTACIEWLVVAVPAATCILDGISINALIGQLPVLAGGIAAFVLLDLGFHPRVGQAV